jgi:hypothetical protein
LSSLLQTGDELDGRWKMVDGRWGLKMMGLANG